MSRPLELKALYYPYARCSNEGTLKRAILLFDQIGFVDPTTPSIREVLMADEDIPQNVIDDWRSIREDYGVLLDRGIVKLYNPEPLIQKYDKLLGSALKADLEDENTWQPSTQPGTPKTWSVLRSKVPASVYEFLLKESLARIDPRLVLAHFGPAPLAYRGAVRRSHIVDHYPCVFPFTHGSLLAVNTALILAEREGLVPFTDSKLHHEMLAAKFQRVTSLPPSAKAVLAGVTQLHPEKLRRVAFTLLDVMVPEELIQNLSISECIKYRDASADAFHRLKIFIGELTSQIESEPVTEKFERELQKLIYQKVLPEAQRARDKGMEVYDKLFGRLSKRVVAALTPTLSASILLVLSSPEMMAVTSAASLGAALPDLMDALVEFRAARRNALSYLLELKSISH